jgi:large subunit ribosomal protein L29
VRRKLVRVNGAGVARKDALGVSSDSVWFEKWIGQVLEVIRKAWPRITALKTPKIKRSAEEVESMKPAEYREMTEEQLKLSLTDVEKNLFHLRFQSATDRLETPSEIRKAKREIARIMTIKREKTLANEKNHKGGK